MNKPVNPHGTPDELLARLNEEEVRVWSLPIHERTQSQQEWIDGIDAHIAHETEDDPNVDVDAVPPPFQYPPGAKHSIQDLPHEYIYYAECHLNWYVVYTVKKLTLEIVGVSDSVKLGLIDPTVAECRDGNCKRAKCQPDAFESLVHQRNTFRKGDKEAENDRSVSFEAYGAEADITEDTFGYYIDFGPKIQCKSSVLEPGSVYCRQFSLTTSSPVV